MKEISLEESKRIQVDLLKSVHEFCVENELCYNLMFGTLIGAIRHEGFIPWDDDIDICMPRKDYDRFFASYGQRDYMKAICCENDSDYYLPFGKVVDTRTVLKENIQTNATIGVYIDVFPMDELTGNEVKDRIIKKRLLLRRNMIALKTLPGSKKRRWDRRILHRILSAVFSNVDLNKCSVRMGNICRNANKLISGSNQKLSICANVDKQGILRYYNAEDFVQQELRKFENNEFYVPKAYDRILKSIYGDYMKLPPMDKRVLHHEYQQWWKE